MEDGERRSQLKFKFKIKLKSEGNLCAIVGRPFVVAVRMGGAVVQFSSTPQGRIHNLYEQPAARAVG